MSEEAAVRSGLSSRPFDPLADAALAALRTSARERTAAQIAALVAWCESKGVAPGGATVNLESLSRAMRLEEHADETILFRQGDAGHTYYIVFSGDVSIYVNSALAALSAMQAPSKPLYSSGSSRLTSKDASVRQTPRIGSASSSVKQTPRQISGLMKAALSKDVMGAALDKVDDDNAAGSDKPPGDKPGSAGGEKPTVGATPRRPSMTTPREPPSTPPMQARERRSSQSLLAPQAAEDKAKDTAKSSSGRIQSPQTVEEGEAPKEPGPDLGKCVLVVSAGKGFGDLALMSSQPRAASAVVSGGPAMLIAIRREAYDSIVKAEAAAAMRHKVALLRAGVPPVKGWTSTLKRALLAALQLATAASSEDDAWFQAALRAQEEPCSHAACSQRLGCCHGPRSKSRIFAPLNSQVDGEPAAEAHLCLLGAHGAARRAAAEAT